MKTKTEQGIKNFRLIAGLSNPGPQYALTYHNVGQLALDYLIEKVAGETIIVKGKKQKNFEFFKSNNGHNLIFIKPLTFMNDSGEAIVESLKYFKIKPEEILVIHDDSDVELGKLKFSFGRGAAGHHGIESIIKNLKTKNFWRARIGIRPKAASYKRQASRIKEAGLPAEAYRAKAGEMVLKKINPSDKLILNKIFSELKI